GPPHGRDTFGDEIGLSHEAGAEATLLRAIGWTADIEIDLAIAEILAPSRSLGEKLGIAAADLQGDRLLGRIEADKAFAVTVTDRLRRHHLGVEQGMTGHPAVEETAVPVTPIHHGAMANGSRWPLAFARQCSSTGFSSGWRGASIG